MGANRNYCRDDNCSDLRDYNTAEPPSKAKEKTREEKRVEKSLGNLPKTYRL